MTIEKDFHFLSAKAVDRLAALALALRALDDIRPGLPADDVEFDRVCPQIEVVCENRVELGDARARADHNDRVVDVCPQERDQRHQAVLVRNEGVEQLRWFLGHSWSPEERLLIVMICVWIVNGRLGEEASSRFSRNERRAKGGTFAAELPRRVLHSGTVRWLLLAFAGAPSSRQASQENAALTEGKDMNY